MYWVYIMASRSRVLYIGVTNDLDRRVREHKGALVAGFTQKYHVDRLVYWEEFTDIRVAIAREKEMKGWVRSRKRAKDLPSLGYEALACHGVTCDANASQSRKVGPSLRSG